MASRSAVRRPQLHRQGALGRQAVARLQPLFLHQAAQLRGHLVRDTLRAHGAIVARSAQRVVGQPCMAQGIIQVSQ